MLLYHYTMNWRKTSVFIDKNHQWTEVNRPVLVNTSGVYLHGNVYSNINTAVIQTYQTQASVIQLSL